MTEWRPVLRHVADVTPLNAEETELIRTAMLAVAAQPSRTFAEEQSPAGPIIGGLLAVAVAAGVIGARSVERPAVSVQSPHAVAAPAGEPSERLKHLQFATPGAPGSPGSSIRSVRGQTLP
ncbi:MAG: hypothetical protein ABIS06_14570 [Vicinamibacterales bacterium]